MRFFRENILFSLRFKMGLYVLLVSFIVCVSFVIIGSVGSVNAKTGLEIPEEDVGVFDPNGIMFYMRNQCADGSSDGICGNTAKEKYWTAISAYINDPIKVAGILGNLASEGNFQPVLWEYSITNSDGTLTHDWDFIYGGGLDGKKGVGAFAITSGLSKYLKAVEENDSSMIEYFKNSVEYSIGATHNSTDMYIDDEHPTWGDILLEKVGDQIYDKLIDFEIDYALGPFEPSTTQEYIDTNFSSPSEAAYWWMDRWERPGVRNPEDRERYAEKVYDDYKDLVCSDTGGGSCKELGELRTKMWTEASQADRESFMKTVSEENHSIAGVEGYMNQVVAKYGSDGTLHDWLTGQCERFRPASATCTGSYTITNEEQDWINEALDGSNNIKFAVGNATGGSNVGAGKIVCVWDGEKCRDDVDYSLEGGEGLCNVYSPSADFGECWGLEGAEDWVNEISAECGGGSSSSSNTSKSSSGSSSSSASSSSGLSSGGGAGDKNITLIGDSIAVGAEAQLKEKFPDGFFTMVGSRAPTQGASWVCSGDVGGLANVEKLVSGAGTVQVQHSDGSCETLSVGSDTLKDNIVWEMGTNTTGATRDTIERVVDLIGNKNLYLVTPYNDTSKEGTDEIAEMYRDVASENDNVYIVEWANAVRDNVSEYLADGIHATEEGKKLLANLIYEAVAGGGECTTGEFVWYPQFQGPYSTMLVEVKVSPGSPDSPKVTVPMGDIGCGPFAFAMMANMLVPQEITPEDTMKVAIETDSIGLGGSLGNVLTKNLAEHYGFEWEKTDSSSTEAAINDINKHLKDGWMIETAGGGSTPYTSGGHYVGIRGIDSSGKWLLADPGHSEDVSQEPWDPKDVVTAGMNIDNVYAFRATSTTPCGPDACKNDNVGSGVEVSKPIGPIHEPSDDIPCDPRTKDLGVRDDAYYNYEQYSIRLCSIPNIKMTGTQGPDGDDGYAHVNSRVSGAFYSLSEEHKKRCGNYLEAYDDYRTNEEQTYYYNCYVTGSCNGGTLAAVPGSPYSNHQGGLAIDFNTSTYCSSDSGVASGAGGLLNSEFLSQFGLEDGRNFSQFENWHVQAAEQ